MAKYTINHTCGHKSEVDLFGKNSERERRITYLETSMCDDCYAKQRAQKMGAEWVEMSYKEYKNHYKYCEKRDYNPKTKTIKVLIAPDKTSETFSSAESELIALGFPKSIIDTLIRDGYKSLKVRFEAETKRGVGRELNEVEKKNQELFIQAIKILEKYKI